MRILLLFLCFFGSLHCQELTEEEKAKVQRTLEDAKNVSDNFVKLLDEGKYAEAWKQGSEIFQMTISERDWLTMMEKTRAPLGRATERKMEARTIAVDPKGLPKGNYVVIVYQTSFSNKPKAIEFLTLRYVDGVWKVLTYQAG